MCVFFGEFFWSSGGGGGETTRSILSAVGLRVDPFSLFVIMFFLQCVKSLMICIISYTCAMKNKIIQVVLAPIAVGMTLNKFFPKVVKAILPFAPVVGVVSTCLLVASAVAQVADPILNAGWGLQVR